MSQSRHTHTHTLPVLVIQAALAAALVPRVYPQQADFIWGPQSCIHSLRTGRAPGSASAGFSLWRADKGILDNRKPNLGQIRLQMPLWRGNPEHKSPPVRTATQTDVNPAVVSLALCPNNSCLPQRPLVLSRGQLHQVLKWVRESITTDLPRLQLPSQQQAPDHRCVPGLAGQGSLTVSDSDGKQRTGAACQPAASQGSPQGSFCSP